MVQTGFLWQHRHSPLLTCDLRAFQQQWQRQARCWQLAPTVLGFSGGEPLMLYQGKPALPHTLRRLVVAGFHGEEPAGVWGCLRFLQQNHPPDFMHCAFSLLPLVNAFGFSHGCRGNAQGHDTNRGFSRRLLLTREGRLLMSHAALLREAGASGTMSCHEDLSAHHAYLYTYERSSTVGSFSLGLRARMARHFILKKSGTADGYRCHRGIIFNQQDDSFECWMASLGVPLVACTETPGKRDFEERIRANAALNRHFLLHTSATAF